MKKPTVAVFFGSRSAEHDVSIITAISAIIRPLEMSGEYQVVPVYIAKDGSWYSDLKLKDIFLYTSGKIDDFIAKLTPVAVQFDGGLKLFKPGVRNKTISIDIAFPATHGTHGEDGELMGVLEMANVPYVGCDVPSSAIAIDKVTSKLIAKAHGIETPSMVYFEKYDYNKNKQKIDKSITEKLKMPLFVKPARLGSSIGITKVETESELTNAIEVALHYDDKVLVEEAVNNLVEVTVPIMGNDEITAALVEQPLSPENGVFDFDTKYINQSKGGKKMGGKQGAQGYSNLPAKITDELNQASLKIAKQAYKAVGCSGIARVDLLIDNKSGVVYFNEINPLPGSLSAHNWRASGVSSVQLVTKLIDLAQQQWQDKQKLSTAFSTNFLKQF